MIRPDYLLVFAAGLTAVAGCGEPGPSLAVTRLQIIAPLPGLKMSVAYMTIHNNAGNPATLTHISSPQFARVNLHETVVENGVASMQPLTSLTLDPQSSVEFSPGGKHVMLSEKTTGLVPGEGVTLHLHFASNDLLIVEAPLMQRMSVN